MFIKHLYTLKLFYYKYYPYRGALTKSDYFLVVTEDDRLYYWGFLDDFKKNDDKILQKIGEEVSDKILAKLTKKLELEK